MSSSFPPNLTLEIRPEHNTALNYGVLISISGRAKLISKNAQSLCKQLLQRFTITFRNLHSATLKLNCLSMTTPWQNGSRLIAARHYLGIGGWTVGGGQWHWQMQFYLDSPSLVDPLITLHHPVWIELLSETHPPLGSSRQEAHHMPAVQLLARCKCSPSRQVDWSAQSAHVTCWQAASVHSTQVRSVSDMFNNPKGQ